MSIQSTWREESNLVKTLIIADDSTGANASAILLKQLNFQTISLIDYQNARILDHYDAIAISTDSRAVSGNEAYSRVQTVLANVKDAEVMIYNKRIDSTLRGNLGMELNAFKDAFPNKKIAIVPAFPSSGRTCKNGLVYVKDVLLEHTDVAKDPKMPIFTSDAKQLFMKQFQGRIANLYLEAIRSKNRLSKKIRDFYEYHDAIVFDAQTNEDIETIAETLAILDIPIITVDPGVFTFYYTKERQVHRHVRNDRYVFVVGSVTDTTYQQLQLAATDEDFDIIPIRAELFLGEGSHAEVNRVFQRATQSKSQFMILTTTDPYNREVLNLFDIAKNKSQDVDQISKTINHHLSVLLDQILTHDASIQGIFTSGGDTTLSFLTESGACGIELIQEVIPLCVYGKIVAGKYDQLSIITKGGMIGTDTTYKTIKEFFQEVTQHV